MEEPLYSPQQIADHLGLKVTTVRKYIKDNKLPAMKLGKNLRVSESDYKKFLKRDDG
jgi:excisionase family DNA binding protein